MKKTKLALLVILSLLFIVFCAIGVWYYTPKTFLKDVDARDIVQIKVFDGSTGKSFIISDTADISYIMENVQGCTMKREKISSGYDGYSFSMSFITAEGDTQDSFIINSADTIRDDPFFYKTESGELCYDYIRALEEKISE